MSQCERVMVVLKDGQPHTIQEIHARAGTMRLNSRVAELRTRLRRDHGQTIACWTAKVDGRQTWVYQIVDLPGADGLSEGNQRVGETLGRGGGDSLAPTAGLAGETSIRPVAPATLSPVPSESPPTAPVALANEITALIAEGVLEPSGGLSEEENPARRTAGGRTAELRALTPRADTPGNSSSESSSERSDPCSAPGEAGVGSEGNDDQAVRSGGSPEQLPLEAA